MQFFLFCHAKSKRNSITDFQFVYQGSDVKRDDDIMKRTDIGVVRCCRCVCVCLVGFCFGLVCFAVFAAPFVFFFFLVGFWSWFYHIHTTNKIINVFINLTSIFHEANPFVVNWIWAWVCVHVTHSLCVCVCLKWLELDAAWSLDALAQSIQR